MRVVPLGCCRRRRSGAEEALRGDALVLSRCAAELAPDRRRHAATTSATPPAASNALFTSPARHDKTVLSVLCLLCRCELDDCSERVQTSNFLSATVLSCWEANSHRRSGRDTDKTVLSCLAWRCKLASSKRRSQKSVRVHSSDSLRCNVKG